MPSDIKVVFIDMHIDSALQMLNNTKYEKYQNY
jgi:hypothetical protein